MVITDTLNTNVLGWVSLGIVIVIGSLVLLRFKTANVGGSVCPGASNSTHTFYNEATDACCVASGNCGAPNTSAISGTGSLINNFVSGIAEPQNWVAIAIIAIIGFAILALFLKRKN